MIILTIIQDKVYEISYLAKDTEYLKYLSLVEKMINSFEIISSEKMVVTKLETEQNFSDQDPLVILKRRFARGEAHRRGI